MNIIVTSQPPSLGVHLTQSMAESAKATNQGTGWGVTVGLMKAQAILGVLMLKSRCADGTSFPAHSASDCEDQQPLFLDPAGQHATTVL